MFSPTLGPLLLILRINQVGLFSFMWGILHIYCILDRSTNNEQKGKNKNTKPAKGVWLEARLKWEAGTFKPLKSLGASDIFQLQKGLESF